MAARTGFVKILFLLFFFQDVFNIVLIKLDLGSAVQAFSALKEILIVVLLAQHWMQSTSARRLHFTSVCLMLLFALLCAVGTWRGLERFPVDGVVFELRTLVLPIMVYFWGQAFVEGGSAAEDRIEDLVRFYVNVSLVFAAVGILDYLFLPEEFWTWVDVGALSRAKGYIATSSGALPDNMYSFFFGRRAFGIAFNPLNLAYMLIPAMVFAWHRRRFAALLLASAAFVLTFSRLPFLALLATVALAMLPLSVRLITLALGAIAVAASIYGLRDVLFADPSASGHFGDIALGLIQQLGNPIGEGIGAAGVYAGNYSALSVESAVLNTANQVSLLGLLAYVLILLPGLRRGSPLVRETRLMAGIYGITAVFAPQILVIKSTFAFFFFLGASAALADRLPARGKFSEVGQGQAV